MAGRWQFDKSGGQGAGLWRLGQGQGRGGGMGGPGQGRGGIAPKAPDDVGLEPSRIQGEFSRGKMTVVGSFKGDPSEASPTTDYGQVFSTYQEEAKHALTKEEIPLGQKETVREYFESVRPKRGK